MFTIKILTFLQYSLRSFFFMQYTKFLYVNSMNYEFLYKFLLAIFYLKIKLHSISKQLYFFFIQLCLGTLPNRFSTKYDLWILKVKWVLVILIYHATDFVKKKEGLIIIIYVAGW